jgi:hypothetical protein
LAHLVKALARLVKALAQPNKTLAQPDKALAQPDKALAQPNKASAYPKFPPKIPKRVLHWQQPAIKQQLQPSPRTILGNTPSINSHKEPFETQNKIATLTTNQISIFHKKIVY